MDIQIHHTPDTALNIIAIPGKIANHIRWLLLLDNRYQFTFVPSIDNYHLHQKDGWPSYDTWIQKGMEDPDLLYQSRIEMMEKLKSGEMDPVIMLQIMRHKWNFIRSWMYHKNRSYHPWLAKTWPIPDLLDQLIPVSRQPLATESAQKTIALVIDPAAALAHHIKFHTGLSSQQKQQVQDEINQHNQYVRSIESVTVTVVDVTSMLTSPLDRTLYNGLRMSYLQNHFDHAAAVHATWLEGLANLQTEFLHVTDSIYRC